MQDIEQCMDATIANLKAQLAEMRHEDGLIATRIHLLSKSVEELEEQYDERLLAIALLPRLRRHEAQKAENGVDESDFDPDSESLTGATRAGSEAQWRRRQKQLDSLSSGEETPPLHFAPHGLLRVRRDVMKSRSMEFSGGVRRGVVVVGGSPTLPRSGRKSTTGVGSEATPPIRSVRKCNTCNESELLAAMNDFKGKRSSSGSLSSSQGEVGQSGNEVVTAEISFRPPSRESYHRSTPTTLDLDASLVGGGPNDDVVSPLKNPLLNAPRLATAVDSSPISKSKSVDFLRPTGRLMSVPNSGGSSSSTMRPRRSGGAPTSFPSAGGGSGGGNPYAKAMSLGRNLGNLSEAAYQYGGDDGCLAKSHSLEDVLGESSKEPKKGWLKRLFSRSGGKLN